MPNAKAEKPRPASFANCSEGLSQAECYASSLHPRAILLASSLFAYDGSVTGNSNTTTAISHMTITEKRNVFKAVSVDSEQSSTREKHQVKNRYRTKNAAGNINWRGSNVSSDALASRSGTSHIQITTTSASFLGCFCITFWVRGAAVSTRWLGPDNLVQPFNNLIYFLWRRPTNHHQKSFVGSSGGLDMAASIT